MDEAAERARFDRLAADPRVREAEAGDGRVRLLLEDGWSFDPKRPSKEAVLPDLDEAEAALARVVEAAPGPEVPEDVDDWDL